MTTAAAVAVAMTVRRWWVTAVTAVTFLTVRNEGAVKATAAYANPWHAPFCYSVILMSMLPPFRCALAVSRKFSLFRRVVDAQTRISPLFSSSPSRAHACERETLRSLQIIIQIFLFVGLNK